MWLKNSHQNVWYLEKPQRQCVLTVALLNAVKWYRCQHGGPSDSAMTHTPLIHLFLFTKSL